MRVAVLGAAGMVGRQILQVLQERSFPVTELRLLATSRSAGVKMAYAGAELAVEEVGRDSFQGIDVAFFCAGNEASATYAPIAVAQGAVVIDKASYFRQEAKVPLVVPEVNPEAASGHQGVIASPNCSTIQLVVALWPLHQAAGLERVVVSTYQSVSGAGREAVGELTSQTGAVLSGEDPQPHYLPWPIAFNLIPRIDVFDPDGYTAEEMKLILETRKIFALPSLRITATAVRVPVYWAHSEAVTLETQQPLPPEKARAILGQAPGVIVLDDPARDIYPMPRDAAGKDEVYVGRIRRDFSVEKGLNLWVVADNLRKGAATNAVQIAELIRT